MFLTMHEWLTSSYTALGCLQESLAFTRWRSLISSTQASLSCVDRSKLSVHHPSGPRNQAAHRRLVGHRQENLWATRINERHVRTSGNPTATTEETEWALECMKFIAPPSENRYKEPQPILRRCAKSPLLSLHQEEMGGFSSTARTLLLWVEDPKDIMAFLEHSSNLATWSDATI
ncbi:hypothetical protein BJ322DRAFT_890666 [Thelephora terrestris]|uniref:Uncharacterized protein n=1 Tax=Thelephora terrestris TaxID=56493 RepID=A0A9P6HCI1_9AGAM|nr:hypothetical protein BJ322DRAFT_890666 [Thelephora terrestris]